MGNPNDDAFGAGAGGVPRGPSLPLSRTAKIVLAVVVSVFVLGSLIIGLVVVFNALGEARDKGYFSETTNPGRFGV